MINEWAKRAKIITIDEDAPDTERLFYFGSDNIAAGRHWRTIKGGVASLKIRLMLNKGIKGLKKQYKEQKLKSLVFVVIMLTFLKRVAMQRMPSRKILTWPGWLDSGLIMLCLKAVKDKNSGL